MLLIVLLSSVIALSDLPKGHDGAHWGITAQQLLQTIDANKIKSGDGFGYAEHLEKNPEVYVRVTEHHERIEYYFFEKRLYKIFIVYDRTLNKTGLYDQLVDSTQNLYGPPSKKYKEPFFDLTIEHTLWEDGKSELDLRKGAGFIYQVRVNKSAAKKKFLAEKKDKGI